MNFYEFLNLHELNIDNAKIIAPFAHAAQKNPKKKIPYFNHLFGDKLRIVIPLKDAEIIQNIKNAIEKEGTQIDWIKGRVLKTNKGIPGQIQPQTKDAGSIGNWLNRAKAPIHSKMQ